MPRFVLFSVISWIELFFRTREPIHELYEKARTNYCARADSQKP